MKRRGELLHINDGHPEIKLVILSPEGSGTAVGRRMQSNPEASGRAVRMPLEKAPDWPDSNRRGSVSLALATFDLRRSAKLRMAGVVLPVRLLKAVGRVD